MLRKKSSVLLISLISIMLLVAACSNKEAKKEDKEIVLDWMILDSIAEIPEFFESEVIAPFEKENPGVKINLVANNDAVNIMRQQLAAKSGPDLISVDGPVTLKQFARSGYLLPLDEYAEKYAWEDRYIDWAYQTGKYEDKYYGLPRDQEALMVWYNKDLFEKNDWKAPETLDELITLNKAIQKEGLIPFSFGTSEYKAANEWWLSVVYNAYLGKEDFQQVLQNKIPWTDDKVKEATALWVDMWNEGYINEKQSQAISRDEARNLFDNQQAVMSMEGTWALSRLEGVDRTFEYDFFIMPSWQDDVETNLPLAIGKSTGINANTKHPEEAAAFLDWAHSPEVAQKFASLGRIMPIKDVDIDKVEGLNPMIAKVFTEVNKYSSEDKIGYASWTFWSPKVQYYLWNNIEAVFMGQMSIEDYLIEAEEQAELDKEDNMLHKFD